MISENLHTVLSTLPQGVRLVAVSKFHPVSALQQAYEAGQRIFGESHVQELVEKEAVLPKDIEWHFIGHLQTNKVKYLAPFVSLIHAVDTLKLLKEINRQAERCQRIIPCLLQIHIAQEETKFGFTPEELRQMLAGGLWRELKSVRIAGLMCMATNTDDQLQIDREFAMAAQIFQNVKMTFFQNDEAFRELSMGMSGDYLIALRHGTTLVRVGSLIFGERDYSIHKHP
ncbi:MAG: YggS family pyridoxal phosphate-dependent enzyme [Bacteroidaceae bacterium]|nr:YggS family pyridoxal phosphate-dependent enzyme [Bacteroidaceae bacterium]